MITTPESSALQADPIGFAMALAHLMTPPGQRRQDWFRPSRDDDAIRRKLLAAGITADELRQIESRAITAVMTLALSPQAWGPSIALWVGTPGDSGWILLEAVSPDRRMH